jgi:hypothetical protein
MGRRAVIDEVGALIGALNPVVACDVDLLDELAGLQRVCQIVEARKVAYLAEVEARRLPRLGGAAHPTPWAADVLKVSRRTVGRLRRLARTLGSVPVIRDAFDAGRITGEQAQLMADAVAVLPVGQRAAGEREILTRGAAHGPDELRAVLREFLEQTDPAGTQQREEDAAARAEQQAEAKAGLTFTRLEGTNLMLVRGYLNVIPAAAFLAGVDALSSPRNRTALGLPADETDTRTPARRRHDAVCEMGNLRQAATTLPDNGGDRPQVNLTIPWTTLLDGLAGFGYLDDGTIVTPATARLMACDALILPVVMNGESMPLDLGRTRRHFNGPTRRALNLRDHGCAFPHCDRPATMCDAHHIVPWYLGGRSDLRNAVLVCARHHRLLHHSGWTVRISPRDGLPEFFAPGDAVPRRNRYHRRP